MHVRGRNWEFKAPCPCRAFLFAGTSSARQFRTVVLCHILGVHVDDTQKPPTKHTLPFTLDDVFAVVGTQQSLGAPFLLEESCVFLIESRVFRSRYIEQVVFVP